jgi:hypothetical protein
MGRVLRPLLVLACFSFVPQSAGCSKGELSPGGDAGNDAGEPSTLACSVASDCTRTEIDHEIHSSADCICLYGCPWTIVNVATANRRMAEYQALCTPGRNAQGQPCGIDDCALPPPLACVSESCVPATDAGP